MQDRLGIAVRLFKALEHQFKRRLEGDGTLVIYRHRRIHRVIRVLLVHDNGHALQRFNNLRLRDDAVAQPVGHVLRRDAQRGTVFH